jgi:hypothetical protein
MKTSNQMTAMLLQKMQDLKAPLFGWAELSAEKVTLRRQGQRK